MDKITVCDLEVYSRVGVTDQERVQPQRLVLNLDIFMDLSAAAASDELSHTIDYDGVVRRLRQFLDENRWKLIEKLAADIAQLILAEFRAKSVTVEVRKFILPQTRHVAVTVTRSAS